MIIPSRRLFLGLILALALAPGCAGGPWPWSKAKSNGENLAATQAEKAAATAAVKNPLALARLSERRGQTEQATTLYEEAIRRAPQDAEAYHRLAVMQARIGQFAAAQKNFAQALALQPDNAALQGDAGYFHYLNSQLPEAEQHLRRALEIDPNNPAHSNNLALALSEQGRYADAFALFRRSGDDTQSHANMAFVLAQAGHYERAMEAYNRVLTADPRNRPAAEAMIELSKLIEQKRPAPPMVAGGSWPPPQVVPPEALVAEGRPVRTSYQAPASMPAAPTVPNH